MTEQKLAHAAELEGALLLCGRVGEMRCRSSTVGVCLRRG